MEEKSYQPTRSRMFEDSDRAYQPSYVSREFDLDSLSDVLSEDEEFQSDNRKNVSYSPLSKPNCSHDKMHVRSYGVSHANDDNDKEYRVEPLVDATTPAYEPTHAVDQDSDSPLESADEDEETLKSVDLVLDESHLETKQCISPASVFQNNSNRFVVSTDEGATKSPESEHFSSPDIRSRRVESHEGTEKDVFGEGEDDNDESKLNDEGFEGFDRDEQPEAQVDGIIADIFGESDAEEEFEGFAENELEKGVDEGVPLKSDVSAVQKHSQRSDEESEEDEGPEFVSDFDRIMERKREELRRRRRRNRDIEFLNDSDDLIIAMISRMKQAAEIDRQLLSENQPATRKLAMLGDVTTLLRRADLKAALVENGMLTAITEWLSPLPGHTLPNLVIRDTMLACLREFQSLSTDILKESGIGKALMYLYKHPRETRENKDKAGRLINEWLRPIFNLTSDYRTLTKEERKQLDYEHLPKRRHIENENYDHRDINREMDGETKEVLRPGDPGWVARARVPQPSNKDYIVRPKWRVGGGHSSRSTYAGNDNDEDDEDDDTRHMEQNNFLRRRRKGGSVGAGIGASSRIETHIRTLASNAKRSHSKTARAVCMSVEGRKLLL